MRFVAIHKLAFVGDQLMFDWLSHVLSFDVCFFFCFYLCICSVLELIFYCGFDTDLIRFSFIPVIVLICQIHRY